jgi:hypothetical protein
MRQQAIEDVVEHCDLRVGVIHGVINEQISDAAQRFHTPCDRPVGQCGVKFVE